ncbi:MAG: hypothetical protein R3B09_20530 [Nannocystaceae bacterium]
MTKKRRSFTPERSPALTAAVEGLYETFASYRLGDPANAGFFDFGPSAEERRAVEGPLRAIPVAVVRSMEFFAADWQSWGSESEVKYVLPRVLECLVDEPGLLEDPSTMSLFKYKLRRGLTPQGVGLLSGEREPVASFMEHLLEHRVRHEDGALGYLIEALTELRFDPARALAVLGRHPAQHGAVADALLDHFRVADEGDTPRGVYCEHGEGLRVYTEWATRRRSALG